MYYKKCSLIAGLLGDTDKPEYISISLPTYIVLTNLLLDDAKLHLSIDNQYITKYDGGYLFAKKVTFPILDMDDICDIITNDLVFGAHMITIESNNYKISLFRGSFVQESYITIQSCWVGKNNTLLVIKALEDGIFEVQSEAFYNADTIDDAVILINKFFNGHYVF